MSRLLKPIAYNIIMCMNQLFDYYLYAVHAFFTYDLVTQIMHEQTLLHCKKSFVLDYNKFFSVLEGVDVNAEKDSG